MRCKVAIEFCFSGLVNVTPGSHGICTCWVSGAGKLAKSLDEKKKKKRDPIPRPLDFNIKVHLLYLLRDMQSTDGTPRALSDPLVGKKDQAVGRRSTPLPE